MHNDVSYRPAVQRPLFAQPPLDGGFGNIAASERRQGVVCLWRDWRRGAVSSRRERVKAHVVLYRFRSSVAVGSAARSTMQRATD